jgi:hypothetical protein
MILDADTLYGLIPAIYRARDAELVATTGGPGPLREIVDIVAGQLALVDAEVDRLYDDLFIETCAQWVVPYIGDLVGYVPLGVTPVASISPRAEVANTIRYRRWKGTPTILEQLAEDVTGWSAVAVEFFSKLVTTQFVNHVRLDNLGTVNVRNAEIASRVNTPFDRNAHRLEVRSIRSKRGRWNIPNIGVYVWRLGAFANAGADFRSEAFRMNDGLYTFDPIRAALPDGMTPPIVQLPTPKRDPFTRTLESDVPEIVRRRAASLAGPPYDFTVCDGGGTAIADPDVEICDLSAWTTAAGTPHLGAKKVAVDPELGRIWFPPATVAASDPIFVNYAYAFSGGYGAGFYARPAPGTPTLSVQRDPITRKPDATLVGAVNAARGLSSAPLVNYATSLTDRSGPTVLTIGDGENITVRAADRTRPVFLDLLTIDVNVAAGKTATLVLDGFVFAQGIVVKGTGSLQLFVRHATVRPNDVTGLALGWSGAAGAATIEHTLCGPLELDSVLVDATIADSVIDAGTHAALRAHSLTVARSTIFGTSAVHDVISIENSIFTGDVVAKRLQVGCVRFSYLTTTSTTPHRYRCQPETAAQAAVDLAAMTTPAPTQAQLDELRAVTALQNVPFFTSSDYGTAAYAQLSGWTTPAIDAGADDDGEMGVFHDLFAQRRETNLQYRLDENLRIGLESGVLHAS